MTKERAIETVWDYMHLNHQLKKADLIFVLGSNDARVASYAAELWQKGWAPYLAFSGDGRAHEDALLKDAHGGKTEAERMAEIAMSEGVPEDAIIIENQANNTGQNYELTKPLITARGIETNTVIIVQKPYMERRAYATGKIWWSETELIITSPPYDSFDSYVKDVFDADTIVNIMVGDLERIKEYPKRGFQIEQDIPDNVWGAFAYLVSCGYDKRLLK